MLGKNHNTTKLYWYFDNNNMTRKMNSYVKLYSLFEVHVSLC